MSLFATPVLRRVQREWLDELPEDDPRAIRSRRDLGRVNTWMLQPGIMARALLNNHDGPTPRSILDLGSGDGSFILRVAKMLARHWPNVAVTMLDRQDIVSARTRREFEAIGWTSTTITADLLDAIDGDGLPQADCVTANLFFHHFNDQQLARIFSRVARLTPLFVACEPRRAVLPHVASHLLWAIGCNDVSRHDAVISVEAGFNGAELSALWPERDRWQLREQSARLFSHCFVARANEPSS